MVRVKTLLKSLFLSLGVITFIYILLSFIGVPHMLQDWLAEGETINDPDFIVLLPAGDVPNPHTLMRIFYTVMVFKKAKYAKVIISAKADEMDDSAISRIRQELIFKGVPKRSILLEKKATNTREHALFLKEARFGNPSEDKYLLVTSPSHIKRALLTFKAYGYKNVFVCPARIKTWEEDIGGNRLLRYRLWEEMETGIVALRELIALLYYKLIGWI